MVRVPATEAKWATWKRYCHAAGLSMGRAIVALIDRELATVFVEMGDDEVPMSAAEADGGSPGGKQQSRTRSVVSAGRSNVSGGGVSGCASGTMSCEDGSSRLSSSPNSYLEDSVDELEGWSQGAMSLRFRVEVQALPRPPRRAGLVAQNAGSTAGC
jgi:hypothetical protein